MAKCNLLGRGEAHLQKKLEKAKGKINKLKMRIQELETAIEEKNNEVLRAIKASKEGSPTSVILNVDDHSNNAMTKNSLAEVQMEQSFVLVNGNNVDLSKISPIHKTEDISSVSHIGSNHPRGAKAMALGIERRDFIIIDASAWTSSVSVHRLSSLDLQHQNQENVIKESAPSMSEADSDINGEETLLTGQLM
ncbi:hypothetical protein SLEP1_g9999 [Rubroshorea leprosula]|uniref:Uncharacterized protein n=1 Tax=Rubroshorea leprosula TaxID=152421 RepID=A0AAV5IB85_9ROSI|nr:hypothetical protein SLEP1_g9999 [Rubroshorea leprosula]